MHFDPPGVCCSYLAAHLEGGGCAFEKWSSIPSLFEEDEDHRHVCVLVFQNVMHYSYNKH